MKNNNRKNNPPEIVERYSTEIKQYILRGILTKTKNKSAQGRDEIHTLKTV